MEGGSGEKWNSVYRECLRNHAASLGSYATDGCGEFTVDGGGLQCAACGCHRNFHRKVKYPAAPESPPAMEYGEGSKKRVRSKFSAEQKEKMLAFAEKLGWKLQRKDLDDEIERFCRGIGVSRQVFKVWMHNHKNSNSSSSTGNVSSLTQ
uniref:ZF-HD homeobox protein At4g24660 family n=2 Tax=Cajanus cajan TaxID=3821 RepID=A0A151TK51_CAJCA|nr:ZF-HD homeobox protein At4g24660 family [Cajanus cajan]